MLNLLPTAPFLPLNLPTIEGNVDYLEFRRLLDRLDALLRTSGLETQFIQLSVQHWSAQKNTDADINPKQQVKFQEHSRRALRCNILRTFLQLEFRGLAVRLADSPLLQRFCDLAQVDKVKVPSKSTLQRYATWLPEAQMHALNEQLLRLGRDDAAALKLAEPLALDVVFLDCTCVKANIHFPVDWVLLRDAVRTLMQAVQLIRQQGLKHRMPAPEQFLKNINQLCLKMTHAQRRADSKKQRKKILREM
ncbi:MAG: transposase, partial [Deltaproteobacteria bacterium]